MSCLETKKKKKINWRWKWNALSSYILCLTVSHVQYFPGRPVVMNLLKSLNTWLQNQVGNEITYDAFKEILENTAQVSEDIRYQNSHPCCCELRPSCLFSSKFLFSSLFVVCLPFLVFIGLRRGLSIRYCTEEEHECKWRKRTDFCETKQTDI